MPFIWRRKWQSTPVFLPGESHGQRSVVGYSPRGRKELDTTERLHLGAIYISFIFVTHIFIIQNNFAFFIFAFLWISTLYLQNIFLLNCFSLNFWSVEVLYVFCILILCCKYFFLLSFNFAYGVFFHIEVLVFEAVKFISFL